MHKNKWKIFMVTPPLVSVILPIKDSIESAQKTIESVIRQNYPNIELILAGPQMKKSSEMNQKRSILKINEKLGKVASRNTGARAAKGKYLLHIDDDMYLSPSVVSECVLKAEKMGYTAIIIPEQQQVHNYLDGVRAFEKKLYIGAPEVESARFVTRSLFEKVGGFDEDLRLLDERNLHRKLYDAGARIGRVQSPIDLWKSQGFFQTIAGKKSLPCISKTEHGKPSFRRLQP